MHEHTPSLTPTQARVKNLLDDGLNVRQIARALDVSTQAVYKVMDAAGIAPPTKPAAS